jgi:hypothetical protein
MDSPFGGPLPDDLKPGSRGRLNYCMRSAIAASRSWPRLVDVSMPAQTRTPREVRRRHIARART